MSLRGSEHTPLRSSELLQLSHVLRLLHAWIVHMYVYNPSMFSSTATLARHLPSQALAYACCKSWKNGVDKDCIYRLSPQTPRYLYPLKHPVRNAAPRSPPKSTTRMGTLLIRIDDPPGGVPYLSLGYSSTQIHATSEAVAGRLGRKERCQLLQRKCRESFDKVIVERTWIDLSGEATLEVAMIHMEVIHHVPNAGFGI